MGKILIFLFTILPITAYSQCVNWIAESEIPKAIAMEPGAGAKKCGGSDPCVCFDGVDWETAEYSAKKFSVSAAKVAQKEAREAEKKTKEVSEAAKFAALKEKIKSDTAKEADLREALKFILIRLGE